MNAIDTHAPHQTNTQNVAANTPVKETPIAKMGARHCCNVEVFNRSIVNCCIGGAASAVTGILVSAAYSFMDQHERDYALNFFPGAMASIGLAAIGMGANLMYISKKYINSEKL